MMRIFAMLVLASFLASSVRAQDAGSPEALAAARELSAMMTGDTITQITTAMTAQVWPGIERTFGSKVDAATLTELRTEFEKMVTVFTADVMKAAPAVYARHFSAQELHDMVAFYKSPTGAKALQEMPKVMVDVGAQMTPRMQVFQNDLNTRVRAILDKHGYKQ